MGRLTGPRISHHASRGRIKLSAATIQLSREPHRLRPRWERFVVQQGQDALLTQEDLNDLLTLLHGQILLLAQLHLALLPARVVARLVL